MRTAVKGGYLLKRKRLALACVESFDKGPLNTSDILSQAGAAACEVGVFCEPFWKARAQIAQRE